MLRRCRDCLKTVFQKGKNTDINAIKHATQPRIQTTILSSQNHHSTTILSTKIPHTHTYTHTHTHTHNKSNQILYFKNKSRQFSEHTLTYVNLVMAKSHCTCTCIKSSKEYHVLCVKNIARLHKCLHVMTI